ncbi:hypothetical protein EDB19DRAFT_1917237 [Suillus lakei]|nr:hypothetical protein EDB19DRAFT_1917237 [Suillus lakei]
MPNQHKPTPPLDELAPHILRYWKTRLNDKEIVLALQKHFDMKRYGIGLTKFRQIRVDMGLERSQSAGSHYRDHPAKPSLNFRRCSLMLEHER